MPSLAPREPSLAPRVPSLVTPLVTPPLSPSHFLQQPSRRQRYHRGERLGAGGMAEVFRGTMTGAEGFARTVAIKRLLPALADQERYEQLFVREAQLASQLSHSNIVNVIDFERDPTGCMFLVMEFVDGIDLGQLLHAGPLPHALVVFLISEILCGLCYVHNSQSLREGPGVVHRDLSPHNILLSWEGAVKVADFGLAKTREAAAEVPSSGTMGTFAYISPEHLSGQRIDERSDLFSVGVMLWEMLTWERLFWTGDTNSTIFRVHFEHIPRPSFVRPVARDLEAVVMKLLQRDPSKRYPTADAALAALRRCDDAPANGRADLVRLLADRFPQHAPPRRPRPGAALPGPPRVQLLRRGTMSLALPPHLRGAVGRRRHAWWALIAIAAAAVLLGVLLGLGVERALRVGQAREPASWFAACVGMMDSDRLRR